MRLLSPLEAADRAAGHLRSALTDSSGSERTVLAALAGYLTYALVIGAAFFASRRASRSHTAFGISSGLCLAALTWVILLFGFLSFPRSARTSTMALAVSLLIGAVLFFLRRRSRVRSEVLDAAEV